MNQTSIASSTRFSGSTTHTGMALRHAAVTLADIGKPARTLSSLNAATTDALTGIDQVATTLEAIPEAGQVCVKLDDLRHELARGYSFSALVSLAVLARECEAVASLYERRAWANNLA